MMQGILQVLLNVMATPHGEDDEYDDMLGEEELGTQSPGSYAAQVTEHDENFNLASHTSRGKSYPFGIFFRTTDRNLTSLNFSICIMTIQKKYIYQGLIYLTYHTGEGKDFRLYPTRAFKQEGCLSLETMRIM